ncbi:MAG: DUF4968 domain-containing protein, partial [Bacteroidales bacterium]|nr:DUF4968 domain-containing protein [Bacteroidales bacterium]
MKRLLTFLAFMAISFVSFAGQPISAGAAAEPAFSAGQPSGPGRIHSRFASLAAAEYGLSPEADPATTDAPESRSFTTFRMTSAKMTLADGHNVLVDVCDEGIFRVRISPRKEFEESLLERYGCLKTDWAPVKTTETTKGGVWTVSTGKYSLSVNKKTGAISLKDAKGGFVIREI